MTSGSGHENWRYCCRHTSCGRHPATGCDGTGRCVGRRRDTHAKSARRVERKGRAMRKIGSVGIDIGGTKALFALLDDRFNVLDEMKEKTRADKDEAHFTDTMARAVGELLEKAEKRHLAVGCIG